MVDVKVDLSLVNDGCEATGHVISIEADVELAHRRADTLDGLDLRREEICDVGTAADDTHDREVLRPLIVLDDLMRDAGKGSAHRRSVHDGRLGSQSLLFHVAPFTKKRRLCLLRHGTSSKGLA